MLGPSRALQTAGMSSLTRPSLPAVACFIALALSGQCRAAEEGPLRLLEAADGSLDIEWTKPRYEQALTLQNTSASPVVVDEVHLTGDAIELVKEGGNPTADGMVVPGAEIPPHARRTVKLFGDLGELKPYESTLSILYQVESTPPALSIALVVPIKINRKLAPAPFVIAAVDRADFEVPPFLSWGPVLNLVLEPTTTDGAALSSLKVGEIKRKVGNEDVPLGGAIRESVVDAQGKELALPTQEERVGLSLATLTEPGAYTAKVSARAENSEPTIEQVEFWIRRPIWFAGIFILAGVLGGFCVQNWVRQRRPRLLRERQAALLASDLDRVCQRLGDLDEEERALTADLRWELTRKVNDIGFEDDTKLVGELDRLRALLSFAQDWIICRRALERVGDAADRERLKFDLGQIKDQALRASDTSGVDAAIGKVAEVLKLLETRRQQLLTELKAWVLDVGGRLSLSLPSLKARIQETVLGPATAIDLRKAFNLDETGRLLANAQVNIWRILAAGMSELLEHGIPAGVEPSAWKSMKGEIEACLRSVGTASDPEEARHRVEQAARGLAEVCLGGALVQAGNLRSRAKELDDAKRGDWVGRMDAVTAKAQSMLAQRYVAPADELVRTMSDVAVELDGLARELPAPATSAAERESLCEPSTGFERTFGEWAASLAPPPQDLGVTSARRELQGQRGSEAIARSIRRGDYGVLVLSLIAALILGLSLLWAPNAAWGTWGDILVALAWGFGLQTVAGADVFQGVFGVRNQIAGVKAG